MKHYYLITYRRMYLRNTYAKFENFDKIKKDVIKHLDSCGWDNKDEVDLRSLSSCIHYLFENVVKIETTTSFRKFVDFGYNY